MLSIDLLCYSRAGLVTTLRRVVHRVHNVRAASRHHLVPDSRQPGTPRHDGEDTWTHSLQVEHTETNNSYNVAAIKPYLTNIVNMLQNVHEF